MANDAAKVCPRWIDDLVEDVGACLETGVVPAAYDIWGPEKAGKFENIDDPWIVHYYPSLSELVGGPADGTVFYPDLTVDVLALQDCLEDVEELKLSSRTCHGETRYPGAALDMTGWYLGHPVLVRVFEVPPDDAWVESLLDHRSGRLRIKEGAPKPARE